MIKDSYINVNITNRNIKRFTSLGYKCSVGDVLLVHYIHANSKSSSNRVECICKCGDSFTIVHSEMNHINTSLCPVCRKPHINKIKKAFWQSPDGISLRKSKGIKISKSKKGKPSVNVGSRNGRWNPDKRGYKLYKSKVLSYTLSNFKDEVERLPNYHLRGNMGVDGAYNIDHRVSIKYGYDNNIPYQIIGHIENLEMIPWEENTTKRESNSIDITELLTLIKEYKVKKCLQI